MYGHIEPIKHEHTARKGGTGRRGGRRERSRSRLSLRLFSPSHSLRCYCLKSFHCRVPFRLTWHGLRLPHPPHPVRPRSNYAIPIINFFPFAYQLLIMRRFLEMRREKNQPEGFFQPPLVNRQASSQNDWADSVDASFVVLPSGNQQRPFLSFRKGRQQWIRQFRL